MISDRFDGCSLIFIVFVDFLYVCQKLLLEAGYGGLQLRLCGLIIGRCIVLYECEDLCLRHVRDELYLLSGVQAILLLLKPELGDLLVEVLLAPGLISHF